MARLGLSRPAAGWAAVYLHDQHVPQTDLPALYLAADAFVLPSRGEGWGRPHTEAMAMELPIIATNWSGPTEVSRRRVPCCLARASSGSCGRGIHRAHSLSDSFFRGGSSHGLAGVLRTIGGLLGCSIFRTRHRDSTESP